MGCSKQDNKNKRCGLCGKSGKLTKTYCCNNWICDDTEKYVMFSYARNSCYRNHDRYTLCSFHKNNEHKGEWKTCRKCRNDFDKEDYVWYGTNEYNFERLKHPPKFNPTICSECGNTIIRGEEGYTRLPSGKFLCEICGSRHFNELTKKELKKLKSV